MLLRSDASGGVVGVALVGHANTRGRLGSDARGEGDTFEPFHAVRQFADHRLVPQHPALVCELLDAGHHDSDDGQAGKKDTADTVDQEQRHAYDHDQRTQDHATNASRVRALMKRVTQDALFIIGELVEILFQHVLLLEARVLFVPDGARDPGSSHYRQLELSIQSNLSASARGRRFCPQFTATRWSPRTSGTSVCFIRSSAQGLAGNRRPGQVPVRLQHVATAGARFSWFMRGCDVVADVPWARHDASAQLAPREDFAEHGQALAIPTSSSCMFFSGDRASTTRDMACALLTTAQPTSLERKNMAKAKATIDHETIKNWVEERGGCPAHVKGTGSKGDAGILRIDYTGFSGQQSLEKVPWKTFFRAFEDNKLAFLFQEDGDSRFSKLVARDGVELDDSSRKSPSRGKSSKAGSKRSNGARKRAADAIELLTSQHREVEALFDQIQEAKGAKQKERLFGKIADALAAHSKIEETIFYPAAFSEETEEELREAVEEHLMAKRLINDLMKMSPDDPQYMSKIKVLKENIQHHVEEEEEELFPRVREQSHDDLEVLGARMEQRYRQLMKEHPSRNIPKETSSAAVSF